MNTPPKTRAEWLCIYIYDMVIYIYVCVYIFRYIG